MHRSNDATKFIFLSLAIYSLIWIFQHGFHTLWADLPLGILFGVAIYLYFSTAQTRSTYELVTLAATLAVMALIKQIGIVFVAMTLALIGLDLLIQKNKNKRHSVAIFLMLFLIPLLVNSLWRHYAKLQGLNKTFSPHFSFQDAFLSIWPSTATARQVITRERFIDYVFFTHHMGTYWFVVLIVALISLHYMHLKHSLERPRRLLITWLLVPEFFAYLGFLLLLYMFSFTEWEGVRLASIDRYSNSFLLGAVMAVLGLLAYQTELLRSREIKAPWFFVVTLLCILPNFGRIWFDTKNSFTNPEPVSAPYQIKNLASKILPTIDRDASIYLIWQGGSNDELTIFQFFMRPHQVNSSCASIKTIASLNDENDPWSCKKTVDAFKANLHKFDYLVIGKADFDFSENFLKHLRIDSVKNGDIYKIIHSDQKISLDPVSIQINSKSKITDQNQP